MSKTAIATKEPTYEELKAKLEKLEADSKKPISFKISDKGGCSVYGLGRFPVTLYYEQWMRLLNELGRLQDFLAQNREKFKMKEA